VSRLALTGASGFVGKEVSSHLRSEGHDVVSLKHSDTDAKVSETLRGRDAVIHLAGEPIGEGRWTAGKKAKIRGSRIDGTRRIVDTVSRLAPQERPKTLICASATGFYGDRGEEALTEDSAGGDDFLAGVVRDWEKEALLAEGSGVRVILIRQGMILGRGGGALAKMHPVVLGSGRQWMSWVHLTDVARFISFALSHKELKGTFNMVAPDPVRNADFTRAYAKATGAPMVLWAPALAIRLALGEMSVVVLSSCRAIPKRALQAGFNYEYPTLEGALNEVYRR
jgi:uncharacterized protein (TIGR01777 family)